MIRSMLGAAAAVIALSAPAAAQDAWLPRHDPQTRAVVSAGQQRLVMDSGVPEDVAQRVFDVLDRDFARGTESITVYRIPGERLLLATAFARVRRDDVGLRLFLVDTANGGATVIDRGRDGAGSAYELRPVFFSANPGRTLIMAGIASGRPRGVLAYEVVEGRLRRIGRLAFAAAGLDPRADPPRDPLPHLRVALDRTGWLVGLDADAWIQSDPRRPPEIALRMPASEPLLFRLRGNRLERVTASR